MLNQTSFTVLNPPPPTVCSQCLIKYWHWLELMHICQDLLLIPHLKASIKTQPVCVTNKMKEIYLKKMRSKYVSNFCRYYSEMHFVEENHFCLSMLLGPRIVLSRTQLITRQHWIRYRLATKHIADSKVHGANMGPTLVLSAPDGPHVGPMNLAIRDTM